MGYDVRPLAAGPLASVREIIADRIEDERGFFSETYNRDVLASHGIAADFIQDNQSLSRKASTLRGLHFQAPPFAQAKLVRVIRGSVMDVAVDIRRGSPSYGRHVVCTLTATKGNQIFIPIGFAHGFCTLEPDTEVLYKVSAPYSKSHDFGLLWSDPTLAIAWPTFSEEVLPSGKDRNQPTLDALPAYFEYL